MNDIVTILKRKQEVELLPSVSLNSNVKISKIYESYWIDVRVTIKNTTRVHSVRTTSEKEVLEFVDSYNRHKEMGSLAEFVTSFTEEYPCYTTVSDYDIGFSLLREACDKK